MTYTIAYLPPLAFSVLDDTNIPVVEVGGAHLTPPAACVWLASTCSCVRSPVTLFALTPLSTPLPSPPSPYHLGSSSPTRCPPPATTRPRSTIARGHGEGGKIEIMLRRNLTRTPPWTARQKFSGVLLEVFVCHRLQKYHASSDVFLRLYDSVF